MIDSNETLAYENGRDAGYSEGYEDGVVAFAKYLKEKSFLCDSNEWHSFWAINVEDDLDDLVKDFLRGVYD